VHILTKFVSEHKYCIMFTCHFSISVVQDIVWLFVFKNSARRDFLALGSNGKFILGAREVPIDHSDK
jgi:hypothetical protein